MEVLFEHLFGQVPGTVPFFMEILCFMKMYFPGTPLLAYTVGDEVNTLSQNMSLELKSTHFVNMWC